MQECNLRIIALRTARVRRTGLEPSTREKLFSFLAPKILAAVDSPWNKQDTGPLWDGLRADEGIARGLADGDWDCGV